MHARITTDEPWIWLYNNNRYIDLSTTPKISIYRVTKYNAVIAPWCSSVGERHVDRKIAKLELKTPNNSPWVERHHGCSTSSFVFDREQ